MSTLIGEMRGSLPLPQKAKGQRWSIVLAGGEGRRMSSWIERRHGERRPKQYCAFVGSRTMLQHTLARAVQVAPAPNTVTVIGRGHGRFLGDRAGREIPGLLVEQPHDRGTAAGILLAGTYVRARDPQATVLILPSDHYIRPDHCFRRHALLACELTDRFRDRFVLLAAVADGAETDYGWILPERERPLPGAGETERRVWPVVGFREKPGPEEAAQLLRSGGLWSTLVVAVKLKTLWRTARDLLPAMVDRFDFLHRVLRGVRAGRVDPRRESTLLRDIYLDMQPADFSRDLLEHVAPAALVRPMEDVEWSDWGRPTRVMEIVHRIGSGERGMAAHAV